MGCITCHGGNGLSDDKEISHIDMRTDPIAAEACDQCHTDTHNDAHSMHSNLTGYQTVLQQRTSDETLALINEEAFGNHCESCHTSCGQCHVSRPASVGAGLSAGHKFKKIPPMNLTCTGCHGSRVDMEYKGKNDDIPADVHWTQEGMPCFQCHTADEMHGNLDFEQSHRYDGPQMPSCSEADCHADMTDDGSVEGHDEDHFGLMACETCHAAEYKNCYSCHLEKSDEDVPYFKTEPSMMGVKIGYNPIKSDDRPWKWVVLRHVPIDPDSFAYYGENLLPNFDNRPTWVYATPHNTQLRGPQALTCNDCHGNKEVFLTKDDLLSYEVEANQPVVVEEADIPALIETQSP
ncbi:hypothetical protein QUF58_14285 [Anaerolineales bacterium HSG24]|nr:hypothetical protein [Anaerolineales bacterium HSG24]